VIVADLDDIDSQFPLPLVFVKAVEFLRLHDIHALPDGKIEIAGQKIFALVQRYETERTDSPRFEFHRDYVDLQYIVSGEEIIGWIPRTGMTITDAYDDAKDVAFGKPKGRDWTPVRMTAGRLAIFYPDDGHAPKLAAGSPGKVMKIVIKIAV
jgi:biofilm protein TabA